MARIWDRRNGWRQSGEGMPSDREFDEAYGQLLTHIRERKRSMPHYADGTPARIGDQVVGVPYNTQGKQIVGIVAGLIPGTDACNLRVVYHEIVDPATTSETNAFMYHHQYGQQPTFFATRFDYGAVKDFRLLSDRIRSINVDGVDVAVCRDVLGHQLKTAANVPATYQLFRSNGGDGPDDPIDDNQGISVENGHRFYAVPPATF